jgi:release factor glutamine methyltransferase
VSSILDIQKKHSGQLDFLDLELIISAAINKSREFVLAHPEWICTPHQSSAINKNIIRRIKNEPLSYILKHKEFYGLDFIVNKHTLIPRPETELLIDATLAELKVTGQRSKIKGHRSQVTIIDIGTGSGNIIISIANKLNKVHQSSAINFFGVDVSSEALKIARKNAKRYNLDKKIKFLRGDLLSPIKRQVSNIKCHYIIVANLPYLSKIIYKSAPNDIKKYEPRSALYSADHGLSHYKKLLKQIISLRVKCQMSTVNCFFEISPEQKKLLTKIIKNIFPAARVDFKKDLAGKWRVCKINF